MLPQESNLAEGLAGIMVHPVLPRQWELFNLLSPIDGASVPAMASAPRPTPRLGLCPQTEVLLSAPPGRKTRPALSQGQACQGHSDLEPAAGLSLSSWRQERLFCALHLPGVQQPGKPLRARPLWSPVIPAVFLKVLAE